MPSVFVVEAWVDEPSIHWFHRCDCCRRRFLRAKFYETYTHLHGDQDLRWRWECSQCLIDSITTVAEARLQGLIPGHGSLAGLEDDDCFQYLLIDKETDAD